jgi:hypothetical protein
MALAKAEAPTAHRSATAQIEHWATLGRAIEVMATYGEVLALKRVGRSLPMPSFVTPNDIHELLSDLVANDDRAGVKARIAAASAVRYTTDLNRPGLIVEVRADGTRVAGRFEGRRFIPEEGGKA